MYFVTVERDSQSKDYSVPESFEEMTGRQLVAACRIMLGKADTESVSVVTGIEKEIVGELTPFQLYNVTQLFDSWSVNGARLRFKEWKIPEIVVGGKTYYGPTSNFGNISWGEFVYADQCMMQGYHKAVVAALYRQRREDYDGECDIRVPFSTYGTTRRFEEMSELDEATILGIVLNYRAVRAASLEDSYSSIFPYHDDNGGKPDPNLPDDTPEAVEEEPTRPFSWTAIHRDLLGDRIQDEERFLRLPVHTVLYRLNQLIVESKKSRRTV